MPVQTALDNRPPPPGARLLGAELIDARPADGWLRARFEGRPDFCDSTGFIQAGFLAAMLDDAMGLALFIFSEGRIAAPTLSLQVSFLAHARPGPLYGEGQVVQAGETIAFLEGRLMDLSGTVVARATASARVAKAIAA
ncbi:MAG: PaaI family thioesterase [Phenylobacterium sp.]|nr:PaaI family thioesterase [Phenylobacterium sp.]